MKQGTTPTILLTIENQDLSDKRIYVTFRHGAKLITKTNDSMRVTYNDPDTVLAVLLTQQETLAFFPGQILVDVRWIDSDGTALGTEIATINVTEALLKQVITYD